MRIAYTIRHDAGTRAVAHTFSTILMLSMAGVIFVTLVSDETTWSALEVMSKFFVIAMAACYVIGLVHRPYLEGSLQASAAEHWKVFQECNKHKREWSELLYLAKEEPFLAYGRIKRGDVGSTGRLKKPENMTELELQLSQAVIDARRALALLAYERQAGHVVNIRQQNEMERRICDVLAVIEKRGGAALSEFSRAKSYLVGMAVTDA